MTAKPRKIRDEAFAKRLTGACDEASNLVPPYNYGRLTWIQKQMHDQHGVDISVETVRKWFSGEARPRPDKMKKLADLLHIDESWLSLGKQNGLGLKDIREHNVQAMGATNIVVGLIQISQGAIAFPSTDSVEDFTAIIKHKKYDIYCSLAVSQQSEDTYSFNIPQRHENLTVLGIIPTSQVAFDIILISTELISKFGTARGGHIELVAHKIGSNYKCGPDVIKKISTFSEGL